MSALARVMTSLSRYRLEQRALLLCSVVAVTRGIELHKEEVSK